MFAEIESGDFFFPADAQPEGALQDRIHDEGGEQNECDDADDAEYLDAKIMCTVPVEQPEIAAKEAGEDDTDDAAAAVEGDGTDWIIDVQFVVDKGEGEDDECAADRANNG